MYLKRHIEEKLREYSTFSKVVLLLGARQVGKSTLLKMYIQIFLPLRLMHI
jgi:predicted AAA+ superfamily ATPase